MEEIQPPPAKIAKLTWSEEEQEKVIKLLEERLGKHDDDRRAVQDKLHYICEGLKAQIVELEDSITKELEEKFKNEDKRLQAALNELRENSTANALRKAKAELLVEQSYEIIENDFDSKLDLTTLYKLKTERRVVPELMKTWKPANVRVVDVNRGCVSVQFTFFSSNEERVLLDRTIVDPVRYKCLFFKKGNEQESKEEYPLDENEDDNSFFIFTPDILEAETPYDIKAKMVLDGDESEWSEVTEFTTPGFKGCCVWKKCPSYVDDKRKYSVYEENLRIATVIKDDSYCTIIGNTSIPLSTVTLWNIRVLKSKYNDGDGIYIGIAPSDINQNDINYHRGWYFNCYDPTSCSRPPHKYWVRKFGPRKKTGQYVHTGDGVGVVMDTTKGDLSFVLNGVNRGVAYCGISLDNPLVPCVILRYQGDSVELVI